VGAQINLEVLDTAILEQTNFGDDMKRWLSNLVDVINATNQILTNIIGTLITSAGINVGGSGAGPISVTVVGLTASGYVSVQLVSSSNPVSILTVTPTTNAFDITFSADPGASAIIIYTAFTAPLQ